MSNTGNDSLQREDMTRWSDLAQNLPTSSCHLMDGWESQMYIIKKQTTMYFRVQTKNVYQTSTWGLSFQGLALVLASQFHAWVAIYKLSTQILDQTKGSLHLCQDLLVGDCFATLIFSDHLERMANNDRRMTMDNIGLADQLQLGRLCFIFTPAH